MADQESGTKGTCLDNLQIVDIRDKYQELLFSKFEACRTEKELKESILSIIGDQKIDLDKIDVRDIQTKKALVTAVSCTTQEVFGGKELGNQTYQLPQIISGVVSFLCNPPTFRLPRITFSLQLSAFLKALLQMLIDFLIQLLSMLLLKLLSLAFELCENDKLLNFDLKFNINDLFNIEALNAIFLRYNITTNGNYSEIPVEDDCEVPFAAVVSNEEQSTSNFLGDLNNIITPAQLCSLLNGTATAGTIENVLELLEYDYPILYSKLSNDIVVGDFFRDVGRTLSPDVCTQLQNLSNEVNIPDICSTDYLDQLEERKAIILRKKGFDEETTKLLIAKEKKKVEQQHTELVGLLAKIRDNPQKIFEDFEFNVFCKNNKPGILTIKDIPNMEYLSKISLEGVFSTYKQAHAIDTEDIKDMYFVQTPPTKTIVPRYGDFEFTTPNGRTKKVRNIETSEYLLLKDAGKPVFITKDKDFALQEIDSFGDEDADPDEYPTYKDDSEVTLQSLGVAGSLDGKGTDKLYVADLEKFEKPKHFKKKIIGIIKETKSKKLKSNQYSGDASYSVEDGQYISFFKKRAKYYPVYLKENEVLPEISDNTLVQLPPVIQTNNIELSEDQISVIKKLSGIEISNEQVNQPVYIYASASYTGKPYYKVTNGIKEIISQSVPNYKIDNNKISTENDVFNQFYKNYTTLEPSSDLYITCFANLMSKMNWLTNAVTEADRGVLTNVQFPMLSQSYAAFANKVSIIPFENIANYTEFQNITLEEFINDPCAIQQEGDPEEKSVIEKAIRIPTVRLLVRNHIMKFNNNFLNSFYLFDYENMYQNSEIYAQFLLQTFKQDLVKLAYSGGNLTLNFYETYFTYLDEYFESQIIINSGLFDPFTGEKIDLNQEISRDFKLSYIIKLELLFLRDRYNKLFKKDNDLNLMYFLNDEMSGDMYQKQVFITFDTMKGNVVKTSGFNADAGEWFYACSLKIRDGSNTKTIISAKIAGTRDISASEPLTHPDEQTRYELFKALKETNQFKLLFDYVFCFSRILSLVHIDNSLQLCEVSEFANTQFIASDEAIRDSAIIASNTNDNESNDCFNPTQDNMGLPDFSGLIRKLILKFILTAPLLILKAIVELTDPNISIASKIRDVASGLSMQPLPVLPFSLALLPFTLIPAPFAVGPPVIPPLGHAYLGIDLVEYFISKKNKSGSIKFDGDLDGLGDLFKASGDLCKNGCTQGKLEAFGAGFSISTDGCEE